MSRTYTLHWMHMPTGKTGDRTVEELDDKRMLWRLNSWNAQQPGTWHYWIGLDQFKRPEGL